MPPEKRPVVSPPQAPEKQLADEMQTFAPEELKERFGIELSLVRALTRAGHLKPQGARAHRRYSFQDLIVLRTAQSLRVQKIPLATINRTLSYLRKVLPPQMPLSGATLTARDKRVTVQQGCVAIEPESGQFALPLEVRVRTGTVHAFTRSRTDSQPEWSQDLFDAAYAAEDAQELARAIALYTECLAGDPGHREARVNLGRLLHLTDALEAADQVYRAAPDADATLHFNHAVLLEDLGRESDAVRLYETALAADPGFADAHFNLARLHEEARRERESLKHLLAYRRLLRASGRK